MKKVIPNKPLSHKILYGAALLMFCLVAAPGDSLRHPPLGAKGIFCIVHGCSCAFTPSVKHEPVFGTRGRGRSKSSARAAARKFIPKSGRLYGAPVYIKNPNNTYTCYLKWKWAGVR